MLKLIFGASVYKRYRKRVNFWFRQNTFGCLYFFILFPTLFSIVLYGLGVVDLKTKKIGMDSAALQIFYVLLLVITYKIIVSISRYYKKQIPIWRYMGERKAPGTPWHGLNVAFFFLSMVPIGQLTGYETLNSDDLALHRKQQSAKIKYHTALLIISLIASLFFAKEIY